MRAIAQSGPIQNLKTQAKIAERFRAESVEEAQRLLKELKAMTESGRVDHARFDAMSRALDNAQAFIKTNTEEAMRALDKSVELRTAYGSWILGEVIALETQHSALLNSIRTELGLSPVVRPDGESNNRILADDYSALVTKLKEDNGVAR